MGPIDNNYIKTDTFGLESTVWSPCGYDGILNINSEVRIAPLTSPNPSLMTVSCYPAVQTPKGFLNGHLLMYYFKIVRLGRLKVHPGPLPRLAAMLDPSGQLGICQFH